MIEAHQGAGGRGQRGLRAAAELQRRRRARGRLGVVGPGGVRARGAPGGAAGRGPGRGQGALRGAPSTRQVEWRGFHAHGFELAARRADLRRARPRARAGPRHAAGVPRLHRHHRRARVRRPRRDAGDVLRPDRRQPARAGRVGRPGERARRRRSCSRWRPRSGAARATRDRHALLREAAHRGQLVADLVEPDRLRHQLARAHRAARDRATACPGSGARPCRARRRSAARARSRAPSACRPTRASPSSEADLDVAAALAQARDGVHARRRMAERVE